MKADEWYDLWTRTGNVVIGNVISDLRAVEQERDDLSAKLEECQRLSRTRDTMLDEAGNKLLAYRLLVGKLRAAVVPFVTCPCCYGTSSCDESCTYRTDDPYGWGRLTALRAALAETEGAGK